MRVLQYLVSVSLLAVPVAARADELPEAPTPDAAADVSSATDTILVTATRLALPVDQVPASLTVLDKAAIDRAQDIGVTELLLRTPGIRSRATAATAPPPRCASAAPRASRPWS